MGLVCYYTVAYCLVGQYNTDIELAYHMYDLLYEFEAKYTKCMTVHHAVINFIIIRGVSDLQPDDERSTEVSIRMVGVIEPVEHIMCSATYIHVAPELRLIVVRTMSRL